MRYITVTYVFIGVAKRTVDIMKVAVFLALAFLGLAAAGLEDEWTAWKTRYGKKYNTAAEEAVRQAIWVENYKKVEYHNSAGEYSYELEMNGFADMVSELRVYRTVLSPSRTHQCTVGPYRILVF